MHKSLSSCSRDAKNDKGRFSLVILGCVSLGEFESRFSTKNVGTKETVNPLKDINSGRIDLLVTVTLAHTKTAAVD